MNASDVMYVNLIVLQHISHEPGVWCRTARVLLKRKLLSRPQAGWRHWEWDTPAMLVVLLWGQPQGLEPYIGKCIQIFVYTDLSPNHVVPPLQGSAIAHGPLASSAVLVAGT